MRKKVLEVENLHVSFTTYGGTVKAVRGVSFELYEGETFAIVGESGCGKSVTSQSIMRLLPKFSATITDGAVRFKGKDLRHLSEKEMRKIRGAEISMIFQDPMTALNPTLTVGDQLTEALLEHRPVSKTDARKAVISMLELVGIPNPQERLRQYPHQFSGGMRQRIVIAMALICEPEILIADEPTTALDVTIQAQILELFKDIQRKTGVSIILITHDLGVVAQTADRIAVMYAGKIAETGARRDIFFTVRSTRIQKACCILFRGLTSKVRISFRLTGRRRTCFLRLKGVRLRRAVPMQWKCAAGFILPLQKSRRGIVCAAGFRMKGRNGLY